MKKKTIKQSTMLNLKGFLILIAFGIWVYVIMNSGESIQSTKEAIYSYGGNTLLIISVLYILIILLEFFIDIEKINK
jgi:hypothetical protein